MTSTYYRIQSSDRDPAELLDPAHQTSTVWVGEVIVSCSCDNGEIIGDTIDDDGEYAWETCPVCNGAGEIDDSTRRGVSCCSSLADLHRYFSRRQATLSGCVIVTLTGTPADDEDWDAAEGAVLVIPTAIVSVEPLTIEKD